jgi:hypothetical protein
MRRGFNLGSAESSELFQRLAAGGPVLAFVREQAVDFIRAKKAIAGTVQSGSDAHNKIGRKLHTISQSPNPGQVIALKLSQEIKKSGQKSAVQREKFRRN